MPYWGQGYATEAARAVLEFGFDQLGLNRVFAAHVVEPGIGRVMEKIGMRFEGELRRHERKWGAFSDTRFYGLLRSDRWPGTGNPTHGPFSQRSMKPYSPGDVPTVHAVRSVLR